MSTASVGVICYLAGLGTAVVALALGDRIRKAQQRYELVALDEEAEALEHAYYRVGYQAYPLIQPHDGGDRC